MKAPTERQQRFASLYTRLILFGSVWSIVAVVAHFVLPRTTEVIDDLFEMLAVPAGHTLFSAVYLAVCAGALGLGKRIAWWWALIVFCVPALLGGARLASIDLLAVNPHPRHFGDSATALTRVISVGQVVAPILLIVGLIWARRAFPARLAPGSRRLAVACVAGGLIVSWVVGFSLTQVFDNTLTGERQKVAWTIRSAFGQSQRTLVSGHYGHPAVALLQGVISAIGLILALIILMR